jgi:transcription-repair coupling factor
MSINQPNIFCQKLVAFNDETLGPWFEQMHAHLDTSSPLDLKLSQQQLSLCAALWPAKHTRKFVVVDASPQAAYRFAEAVNGWHELFNVSKKWHFISGKLTSQEIQGLVATNLSRAAHALLAVDSANHFVLSAATLQDEVPDPEYYRRAILTLAVGENTTSRHLISRLSKLGYTRYRTSLAAGGFTVRGENIIIAHPFTPRQYTLTLWHNTVERIVTHPGHSRQITTLTLPPLYFPEATTSWEKIVRGHTVFRPRIFDRLPAHRTIVFDSLRPAVKAPLADCPPDIIPVRSEKKLFVFYQNRDRLQQYVSDRPVGSTTLIKSTLADADICLGSSHALFVSEARIFPSHRATTRPIAPEQSLAFIQELTEGQPAVHSDHGIGIYEGLRAKNYEGTRKEYLLLRYAAGDTLAVPVEYAHKVTAYVGQTSPPIGRLNAAAWAKTKRAARADAVRFARELLATAARRATGGHRYVIDEKNEATLAASFPYELTIDQLRAWREVRRDLVAPHAMDRLVVGDVGFGKTEIAIRAAYHVATNGKQVALLAPTTLLVQQHADTFRQRLPDLVGRIGVLSRFSSQAERKNVRDNIATGELRIIIGTHALLGQDIAWHDLGLVVIDEEQRFGVQHKEHFKNIRARLDLLSLSATPIPRTLSMALIGLKQLSIINAPPPGRKSIKTYVGPDSDDIIGHAIERELKRGGQVYVVAPRVRSLPAILRHIQNLAPQATADIAHGQMPEKALADVTARFDQGTLDILVSSSIIESGLDLPRANTMVIFGATSFGLADLYQLRGRIGRRRRQGYAYFIYNQHELTTVQKQRLATLTETTRLGSGWSLAQRDLEIRGAGNLLGAEQSGAVSAIGVQLYLDMVREASADRQMSRHDVDIQLPLSTFIPTHYIARVGERARAYQLLSRARTVRQLSTERQALEEHYGPLPPEAKNLYYILQLQHAAATVGISAITNTTIRPPRRPPYERLEIHTRSTPPILAALAPLGTWQVRENILFLPVPKITPALVERLSDMLKNSDTH